MEVMQEEGGRELPNFQEWISVMDVKVGGSTWSTDMCGEELATRAA